MGNAGCVTLHLPLGLMVSGSAVSQPSLTADPMRGVLGQMTATLGPFATIFKIISFATDVLAAFQSIPDCITQLSPKPLIDKLQKVIADVDQLVSVLPQVSVPVMVRDLLGAVIAALQGVQTQVAGLQSAAAQASALEQLAASLASSDPAAAGELTSIVQLAIADTVGIVDDLDAQQCALNQLLTTITTLVGLVGLPAPSLLPCFGGATPSSASELVSALTEVDDALITAIELLSAVGDAVGGATAPIPPC
jgi:hypothetical protein